MPSADTTTTTLATDLRRLGFNHTADQLNDLIAGATRKRWSATVLLERIVADELEDKHRRSVESRLKRARLGRFKPLADWDWDWPTALDRAALRAHPHARLPRPRRERRPGRCARPRFMMHTSLRPYISRVSCSGSAVTGPCVQSVPTSSARSSASAPITQGAPLHA